MSMKENVEYIKQEISTEESFLENFFKVEQFVKKYKKALIATASIVVLAFFGNTYFTYAKNLKILEANTILNKVLQNPNDTTAINQLQQKDTKLYNIALYLKDNTASTSVEFLKELALYNKALKEKNANQIATLSTNQNFILKDFALFNQALIQVQNKDYTSAKETLKLIPITSEVSKLTAILNHYLLTKK